MSHKHDAATLFQEDEQLRKQPELFAKYSKLATDAEIEKTVGEQPCFLF